MSIDRDAGIHISDLVDRTARRLGIPRAEAKAVVLDAARAVCEPPPAPKAKIAPPRFQAVIAYAAQA